MKGEKGNANREVDGAHVNLRQVERGQKRIEIADNEIGVFENDEEPEINRDRDPKDQTPVTPATKAVDEESESVVECDRSEHDKRKGAFAPRIKKDAGNEQNQISRRPRGQKIEREHPRQKEEQEYRGTEKHFTTGMLSGGGGQHF